MPPSHEQLAGKVAAVTRRARRWLWIQAGATVFAAMLAIGFTAALTDFWLRLRDPGVRLLVTLGTTAACGIAAWRWLRPAWSQRWDEVALARRIEQDFPELRQQLASALKFLGTPRERAESGSFELREAVVTRVAKTAESLDFQRVIDLRGPRRALGLAGLVALIVAGATFVAPRTAALAARRLVLPLGAVDWPRRTHLELLSRPSKLAAGADLELIVVDRARRLPEQVNFAFQWDDASADPAQLHAVEPVDGRASFRLERVTRALKYRVFGGDDDSMEWQTLELVEPPRVESLELRVAPPDYAGWPAEPAGRPVRALADSRLELSGVMTRPVSSARIIAETSRESVGDENATGPDVSPGLDASPGLDVSPGLEVEVMTDGVTLRLARDAVVPWVVARSGDFLLRVQDAEGVESDVARWTIEAVQDQPPTISLASPPAQSYATPTAHVLLNGLAKDDVGIANIVLRTRRSDKPDAPNEEHRILSRDASSTGATPDGAKPDGAKPSEAARAFAGERRNIAWTWRLDLWNDLRPGVVIEYVVVVRDLKGIEGQTEQRQLEIISPEQFAERIEARLAAVLQQLSETQKLQREARLQTRDAELAGQDAGQLDRRAADQLQSVGLVQEQIRRNLSGDSQGAAFLVAQLRGELEQNRYAGGELPRRLDQLLGALARLNGGPLAVVQRELADAVRRIREQMPAPLEPLARAGIAQDTVIAELDRLLGELTPWDNFRRFAREIGQLRREQTTLKQETETLLVAERAPDANATRSTDGTSGRNRAADRQFDLSRRLDRLLAEMQSARDQLVASDPLVGRTFSDALGVAERTAVSGLLRESAQALQQSRPGRAVETQQAALAALDQLLDALANRGEQELDRIVAEQRGAAAALARLADEQDRLRTRAAALAEATRDPAAPRRERDAQRLAGDIRRQAEQTGQLAHQLNRLRAPQAGATVDQAATQQQTSEQALASQNSQAAVAPATNAARQLRDAQTQLADEMRQTQSELAQQNLARWEQAIDELATAQQGVVEELPRLESDRQSLDQQVLQQLPPRVEQAAEDQRRVQTIASGHLATLPAMRAFQFALRESARHMQRAADELGRGQTGAVASLPAAEALRLLRQLQAAVDVQPRGEPAGKQDDQPPSTQPAESREGGVATLGELVLMRELQLVIRDRTSHIESVRDADGSLPPALQTELDDLARQQGELARMLTEGAKP